MSLGRWGPGRALLGRARVVGQTLSRQGYQSSGPRWCFHRERLIRNVGHTTYAQLKTRASPFRDHPSPDVVLA